MTGFKHLSFESKTHNAQLEEIPGDSQNEVILLVFQNAIVSGK